MSRALKRKFHVEERTPVAHSSHESRANESVALTVQCPQCYTRYTIERSVVEEQSDPRFHCSQCDTIFKAEVPSSEFQSTMARYNSRNSGFQLGGEQAEQEPRSTEWSLGESQAAQNNHPTSNSPSVVFHYPSAETHILEVPPHTEDITSLLPAPEAFSSAQPKLVFSKGPSSAEPSSVSEGYSAQSVLSERPTFDRNMQMQAPHETVAERASDYSEHGFLPMNSAQQNTNTRDDRVSQTVLSTTAQTPTQMELGIASPDSFTQPRLHPSRTSSQSVDLTSVQIPMFNAQSKEELSQNSEDWSGFSDGSGMGGSGRSNKSGRSVKGQVAIKKRAWIFDLWRRVSAATPRFSVDGAAVISLPLVVFSCVLFFLSIMLRANPLESEEMITSAIPGIVKVAPPGLAVIEARMKKIVLDSGETIFALSGRVKNNSGKSVHRIQIDGLIFDQRGTLISQRQITAASPLTQSRLKALSLDMIEDIENKGAPNRTVVKDGESVPFVATFRPQELTGSRYFSTRINSVQ